MSSSHPDKPHSMTGTKKSKAVTRLQPRRVELVRPTHQPSKTELEEPITLPQLSLEEAARRLMKSVEIHYIDRPKRKS